MFYILEIKLLLTFCDSSLSAVTWGGFLFPLLLFPLLFFLLPILTTALSLGFFKLGRYMSGKKSKEPW